MQLPVNLGTLYPFKNLLTRDLDLQARLGNLLPFILRATICSYVKLGRESRPVHTPSLEEGRVGQSIRQVGR